MENPGTDLLRLVKWVAIDPQKRALEARGDQVWTRDGLIYTCVWAPGFEKIHAPTHHNGQPLVW